MARGFGAARLALTAAIACVIAAPGQAEPAQGLSLELNKLEAEGASCKVYLLVSNAAETGFDSLKLDLVLFDTAGVVARRLAVQMAPLAAEKTALKVFSLDATPCESVGRILLNAVTECQDATGARGDCLAGLTLASRAGVDFFK